MAPNGWYCADLPLRNSHSFTVSWCETKIWLNLCWWWCTKDASGDHMLGSYRPFSIAINNIHWLHWQQNVVWNLTLVLCVFLLCVCNACEKFKNRYCIYMLRTVCVLCTVKFFNGNSLQHLSESIHARLRLSKAVYQPERWCESATCSCRFPWYSPLCIHQCSQE